VDHEVIADRVEVATFLAAVAIAGGEITIHGARPDHMDMLLAKLGEMGLRTSPTIEGLWAAAPGRLRSADLSTLPYPGIATDYKPLLMSILAVADGVGIVTENLYGANRFGYVNELVRMGADIRIQGHHAVVRGVERLSAAPVKAHDLRAGAGLVLAGLGAEGETVVADGFHVDRGYDDLAGKLRSLGADVTRER
jgi:UDP-N-acetylglucosamine 1-carboxyvinyltransferase